MFAQASCVVGTSRRSTLGGAMTTETKLGFVGLGNMGGNMAARLLAAGYTVYGEAQSRTGAEPLLEKGLQWQESPRALAEAAEVIFTSLPDDRVIEQVASEADGILAGIGEG